MAFNIAGMPLPVITQETALTQRPVSTSVLGVDSQDRYTSYAEERALPPGIERDPYHFSITRSNNIFTGAFTRIAVSEAMLQWTIPNVNFNTAVIKVYTQAFGPTPVSPIGPQAYDVISIPIGFYTPSQLATAVQVAVRASVALSLPNFTMTYGTSTNNGPSSRCVFEYSATGALPNPTNITVSFEALPDTYQVGSFGPSVKQLFDLLGFRSFNTPAYAGWVLTGPGSPYVNGAGYTIGQATFAVYTKYVDVVCTQLTQNQRLRDASTNPIVRDVLARIYLADSGTAQNVLPASSTFAPFGTTPTTLYRTFNNPKQILWRKDQPVPGVLSFELYDDSGRPLSEVATQGLDASDWCLTLLVSEN